MTSPRGSVLLFTCLVFGLSWPLGYGIGTHGRFEDDPLAGLYVFLPGILGVGLSLATGRGIGGLGWQRPRPAALAIAVLMPTFAAALCFTALTVSGADRWRGFEAVTPTAVAGALALFLVGALGEEPGWRGFLLGRYRELGLKHRWAYVGLTWSAWHYPLILTGAYSSSPRPWLSAAIFTVTLTAFGILLGWLREMTESLWPPIVAHAVHNVWFVALTPALLEPGPRHPYVAGESGVFLAAIYTGMAIPLVATYFQRSGARSSPRSPGH